MAATDMPLIRSGQTTPDRLRAALPLPVLLYLACLLLPLTFRAGPLMLNSVRLFLLAIIVPLFIRLLSGRYGRLLATDFLFFLHLLWLTLALAVNNPDRTIEQAGSVGLEFIGGYLVGRAYIRSREAFLGLVRALVAVVLAIIPFAFFEALTGRPLMLEAIRFLPGMSSPPPVSIGARLGLERVQFTFMHPIHFGLFCSVALSLAYVATEGLWSRPRRLLTAAAVAGTGFLALSSGALLAILLQFFLFVWAAAFRDVRQRWWLLVGLFALLYVAIDLLSNRTPIRVFMSYATFSAHTAYMRSIIFEWGMVNVWSNPLFGLGLNDWVRLPWMRSGSMDNFWLVMAVRYGIPGFLLLAAGYLIALIRVMFRDFSDDPELMHIRRAWVFCFIGLTFTLFTVHVWSSIYSFVFFMFGAGIWLLSAEPGGAPAPVPAAPRGAAFRRDLAPALPSAPAAAEAPEVAAGSAAVRAPRYSRFAPPGADADRG